MLRSLRLSESSPGRCRSLLRLESSVRIDGDDLLGSIPQQIRRLHIFEIDVEGLAQDLDFELEIELEFGELVEFDEETEDGHEPGIRRLEHSRFRALLENLADERNRDDESIRVVSLDEEILERDVLLLDRLVLREGQPSEPRSEILEQRSFRAGLDRLLRVEERGELDERLVEDSFDEKRHGEGVEEFEIELMIIRFDAHSLSDDVMGEPGVVKRIHSISHLGDFRIEITRSEIVDDKENLVGRFFVRRLRFLLLRERDVNGGESGSFQFLEMSVEGDVQRYIDRFGQFDSLSTFPRLQRRSSEIGDIGMSFLYVRDGENGMSELWPFRESRLESCERLNTEAEPIRIGRIAQRVEDVANGDSERDKVDELVLDEISEKTGGESELDGRVRVEESMLLEETVEEAGEELMIVLIVGFLGSLKSSDDVLDRDFLLAIALVYAPSDEKGHD